jgi:hypothetical protein
MTEILLLLLLGIDIYEYPPQSKVASTVNNTPSLGKYNFITSSDDIIFQ